MNVADTPSADDGFPVLPADLHELLGAGNPHWAGNFNVFVNREPVERHVARAVRVYPGQVNFALFMVGSGHDAYRFDLSGPGAHWHAALFAPHPDTPIALSLRNGERLDGRRWIESSNTMAAMLALKPPPGTTGGEVNVHVERRSTGETALVEFTLDPGAAGPGCFVV